VVQVNGAEVSLIDNCGQHVPVRLAVRDGEDGGGCQPFQEVVSENRHRLIQKPDTTGVTRKMCFGQKSREAPGERRPWEDRGSSYVMKRWDNYYFRVLHDGFVVLDDRTEPPKKSVELLGLGKRKRF